MKTVDCINHQLGCSCTNGICRSAARRKESEDTIRTILAKRNADTIQMMAAFVFAFGLIAFSFITYTVPDAKRQALVEQENTHVSRR